MSFYLSQIAYLYRPVCADKVLSTNEYSLLIQWVLSFRETLLKSTCCIKTLH